MTSRSLPTIRSLSDSNVYDITPSSQSGAPLLSSYQPNREKYQQQKRHLDDFSSVWNQVAKSSVFKGTDAFAAAASGDVPLIHFLLDTMLETVKHNQRGGLYSPKTKPINTVDLVAVVDEKDQCNTLLHCGAIAPDPGVVELLLKYHGKCFTENKGTSLFETE
eukprot:2017239-Ditylum_brightwellii.AAC.1